MANFKPLKNYLLYLIDQLIEKYNIEGPFLDAGCGIGDISLHLAQKGWSGKAIDLYQPSLEVATNCLSKYKDRIIIEKQDILLEQAKYKTIIVCDVLEHIKKDHEILQHLSSLMNKESKIIISVPIFMKEWRWDDNFYGHIRRYEIKRLEKIINESHLKIVEIWDFTFPVFWFMRRVYTRFLKKSMTLTKKQRILTLQSASHNAWGNGKIFYLIENFPVWKIIFFLQSKFKKYLLGSECILLAEKII